MNSGGCGKLIFDSHIILNLLMPLIFVISLCVILLTVNKKHCLFKWISVYKRSWPTGCLWLIWCSLLRPPRLPGQSSSWVEWLEGTGGVTHGWKWPTDRHFHPEMKTGVSCRLCQPFYVQLKPQQPILGFLSSLGDGWKEGRSQIYLWDEVSFQTSSLLCLQSKGLIW